MLDLQGVLGVEGFASQGVQLKIVYRPVQAWKSDVKLTSCMSLKGKYISILSGTAIVPVPESILIYFPFRLIHNFQLHSLAGQPLHL